MGKQGLITNATGRGGFGDHPENRNPGGWKKEDSIPYKQSYFLRLTALEFLNWEKEHPPEKRTMAEEIAYRAVYFCRADLGYLKEVTDRTSGKAVQVIDHAGGDKPFVIEVSTNAQKQSLEAAITSATTSTDEEDKPNESVENVSSTG